MLESLESAARGEIEKAREGPIEVRGYNFHWQVEAGDGTRTVILSRNLGGSLLVFSTDGAMLAERECDEITSVQWFDIDADGRPEWVTEEIDGRGTGLLVKEYRVYRHRGTSIDLLWSGLSYDRRMAAEPFRRGEADIEVRRGFVRLEPGSGDGAPRLLHWTSGPGEGDEKRRTYVWTNGRLEATEDL